MMSSSFSTPFTIRHSRCGCWKMIYRTLRPGDVILMANIKVSSQLEDNVDVSMST